MKSTRPRIPWKKIWGMVDEYCHHHQREWPKQKNRIVEIVTHQIIPWTIDWQTLWKEFMDHLYRHHRIYRGHVSWEYQKALISRLVRKHLVEPKK